jgi:hypothetical protein
MLLVIDEWMIPFPTRTDTHTYTISSLETIVYSKTSIVKAHVRSWMRACTAWGDVCQGSCGIEESSSRWRLLSGAVSSIQIRWEEWYAWRRSWRSELVVNLSTFQLPLNLLFATGVPYDMAFCQLAFQQLTSSSILRPSSY